MNRAYLLQYSDNICEFIHCHEMEDKDNNLILDYIETLYKKGVDLSMRDCEKEIYIFYAYHKKYNKILTLHGEDKFIDIITDTEIFKMKLIA